MKKKIIITSSVIVFLVLGFILFYSSDDTKDNDVKGNDTVLENQDEGIKLESIKSIRESAKEVMESAKQGKYSNLSFWDIEAKITDEDEIYTTDIARSSLYANNYNMKEDFERIADSYKEVMGDEYDINKIKYITKTMEENGEVAFRTNAAEFYEDIKNGKYANEAIMAMVYDDNKKYSKAEKRIYLMDELYASMFCYEPHRADKYGFNASTLYACQANNTSTFLIHSNQENVYVPRDISGRNDKKFEMIDGSSMSVNEAIEYLEKYLNEYKYAEHNDYSIVVDDIYVMKVKSYDEKDEKYGFFMRAKKEYMGVPSDTSWANRSAEIGSDEYRMYYDKGFFTMIGKENMDLFMPYSLYEKEVTRTSEPIKEIVPLEDAIELLSNEIGTAASYSVRQVELMFRSREYDTNAPSVVYTNLYWKFDTVNELDDKCTRFYVNCINGEIEQCKIDK